MEFSSNEGSFYLLGAQKNRLDETVLFSTCNNVWVGQDKNFYTLMIINPFFALN